ncbi:MAG: diguanylate cyclase [Okeania sp. SIO3I5]|uniref:diguanylate cyclase n=1 Tax=Okeania sp. SIO3I5 TaxID=2607805 RepID=UPI0013B62067|nr:diguanylate cyclase [Okeania sp. SIO3I5]NEQ40085.1 diguanylate cyclase [Okeania sp. SIO3I5]
MLKQESFKPENFYILAVDDISTNLKLLRVILEPIGYSLTFAKGGHQALERIKVSKPDLILLDLMMPEMNGLEVCKQLKSDPEYTNIPIIFLTASNEQEHIVNAFELGAVDYINKPFKKAELLARIRNHLLLKHTIDELKSTQIELQNVLVEVQKLANTDPLTGVLNRRSLFDFAHQEFNRVSRYGPPFSILLMDLDNFKKINDNYGHQVGDIALCTVVKSIKNAIRNVDFLGRYGGEEFMAILPETFGEEAFILAERIRKMVASNIIKTDVGNLLLTISIGVSTYYTKDRSLDDMISRADKGVYQAKQQGRNKCCLI